MAIAFTGHLPQNLPSRYWPLVPPVILEESKHPGYPKEMYGVRPEAPCAEFDENMFKC